jgi:hypothetical protein
MIKEIHIYDIDGTLVDSTHRYRYVTNAEGWRRIDLPFWITNRRQAMRDSLLPLAEQYQKQLLDPNIFTVLATARVMSPEEWQHIKTDLLMPDHFISRPDGDTQSGSTLKINALNIMLDAMPELKNVNDIFIYEDNLDYLNAICDEFNCTGIYVPSAQGY